MKRGQDYRPVFWCPIRGDVRGPVNRTARRYWPLCSRAAIDTPPTNYAGWSNRIAALIRWAAQDRMDGGLKGGINRWTLLAQIKAAKKERSKL